MEIKLSSALDFIKEIAMLTIGEQENEMENSDDYQIQTEDDLVKSAIGTLEMSWQPTPEILGTSTGVFTSKLALDKMNVNGGIVYGMRREIKREIKESGLSIR